MSVNNFIPEIWSARIMRQLEKSLVYGGVCNRDYQGEINEFGDTVRINEVGPVTVAAYTKNSTTVTPEVLNDAQATLKIDQSNYFSFYVDDVDQALAKGAVLPVAIQDATYRLRNTADAYIAALYSGASSITASTPVNSVNVFAAILSLAQALDEKNVELEGRWLIIPPWIKTKLTLAKVLVENTSNEAFENGFVGRVAGFSTYVSNNVNNDATTWNIMAGTTRAISFAQRINKIEAYRPEGKFADAVKGLHLYGAKVVYPDALTVLTATVAAEP